MVISDALKNANVDVLFPAYNSLKMETTAQVFWRKFCEFFQPETFLKQDSTTGAFFWILTDFLAHNFTKNEAPAKVFSCKFCKIFKNTYFEDYL